MHRPPTQGVVGSKPRLLKNDGNGEASKEALARLSHEYLETRNAKLRAQTFMAETQAARARGELIPKKEVKDLVSYALVVFRQRALLSYRSIAQRLGTLNLIDEVNSHAISQVILEEAHSLLNELGHMLPDAANPESGLEELERRELGLGKEKERQQVPGDHKTGASARHTPAREEDPDDAKTSRQRLKSFGVIPIHARCPCIHTSALRPCFNY